MCRSVRLQRVLLALEPPRVETAVGPVAAAPVGGSDGDGDSDDDEDAQMALAAELNFLQEFKDEGWRERRAELLAGGPAPWAAQLARGSGTPPAWAHALAEPEVGAVLLAAPEMGHFQQHYFAQAVILVVAHGERGTLGVIVNRPTPLLLRGERVPPPFRDRALVYFGGDVRGNMMLQRGAATPPLEDSEEVLPGLHSGGSLAAAAGAVEAGERALADFRFFEGTCGWGAGQLAAELRRPEGASSWAVAARSAAGARVIKAYCASPPHCVLCGANLC